MDMTLGQYITAVDLEIDEATGGAVSISEMVDYADGELSLSEMQVQGVTPRKAAEAILTNAGFFRFSF